MQNFKPGKKNGFKCPLHIYQILSWLLTIFNLISALYFIIPQFHGQSFIVILTCTLFLFLTFFYFGFRATYSDSTDPVVVKYHSTSDQSIIQKLEETHERYCSICVSPVDSSSKHCMRCSKCSLGFDHHCKWINNCVARNNYRLFMGLLISVEIYHLFLVFLQLSILVFMVKLSKDHKDTFEGYGLNYYYGSLSIIVTSLCICLLTSILNGYLIYYHIYISIRGITTYEHIVMKSKKIINDSQAIDKSVTQNGQNIPIQSPGSLKNNQSFRNEGSFLLKH